MKLYEVGGCVRDEIMGIQTKDIDFAVEAESFDAMREELKERGFTIFVETPEFLTIRAHFPSDHPQFGKTTADFVLCRKDGPSSNSRHPDFVEPGTIFDDLARRDFRMNAIARDMETGVLIDPFDGKKDIEHSRIQFVGDPRQRIEEDALRALRGLRFQITKRMLLSGPAYDAINSPETAELLMGISLDRVRDEIHKMFLSHTIAAFTSISQLCWPMKQAIFRDNELKLLPTMGKKVKDA